MVSRVRSDPTTFGSGARRNRQFTSPVCPLYQLPSATNTAFSRYWQFLLYLFIALTALELIIAPFDSIYPAYSALIGYIGLSVEATLPIPQLYANALSKSCKGFRFSVLASWLAGDTMKMFWFFTATTEIPLAFKLCGIFQAICDVLIGIQYLVYGSRGPAVKPQQEWELAGKTTSLNGWQTPVGRRSSIAERSYD